MARHARQPILRQALFVLLFASALQFASAVYKGARGAREYRTNAFGDTARLRRQGRSLLGFDPTVTSDSYCKPKTFPNNDKRLEPITFDAAILDLRWAHEKPYEDKVVYALLESEQGFGGGKVWQSRQYGDPGTWEEISTKMEGAFQEDPELFELSGIAEIHYHPTRPDKILFQGAGLKHWIQDGADGKYEAVDTPGQTIGYGSEIKMHPTRPEWLLAKVRRNHCITHGVDRWCAYDVFSSKNFGREWTNLTAASGGSVASFIDFDWGASLRRPQEPGSLPDETIFATVYEKVEHMPASGPFGHGWDNNVHFVSSHNFFNGGHKRVVTCGNMFELLAHRVFLALPSDCPTGPDGGRRQVPEGAKGGGQVTLYVSEDEGATFKEACVPVTIEDKGYNIVRTHDGDGVFLVVDHDEEDELAAAFPAGNVYASGWNDSGVFTLSMRRNFRRNYVVDFVRVESSPGTYLGNQLDNLVTQAGGAMEKADFEKFVKTQVSFDGGARWQAVQPPSSYRHIECNACAGSSSPNCNLHLHGPSSWFWTPDMHPSPALYSHENAPGIVMATGNTGEYLETNGERSCTWLSRDGGLTWIDVANHAAIYEFGDHGSLVLAASFMTSVPTDRVYFSSDEGRCWNTVLLEEAIFVENIRVEPAGASHIFMVHGTACFKDEHQLCQGETGQMRHGKLYQVDVRELRGNDWRTCEENDYVQWSPPKAETCLLGRNYTVQRQKWDSVCFNSEDYKRPDLRWTDCPCTDADYECEFGYEPDNSGKCVKMEGIDASMCPAVDKKQYVASSTHMRQVHGSQCRGHEEYLGDTDGRGHMVKWDKAHTKAKVVVDGSSGGGGEAKWISLSVGMLIGALLLLCGFVAWWLRCASEYTKASLEDCAAPLLRCCCGAIDALRARVSGASASRSATDSYFQPLGGPVGLELGEEDRRSAPMMQSMR